MSQEMDNLHYTDDIAVDRCSEEENEEYQKRLAARIAAANEREKDRAK